jgi:hypothetical protein
LLLAVFGAALLACAWVYSQLAGNVSPEHPLARRAKVPSVLAKIYMIFLIIKRLASFPARRACSAAVRPFVARWRCTASNRV